MNTVTNAAVSITNKTDFSSKAANAEQLRPLAKQETAVEAKVNAVLPSAAEVENALSIVNKAAIFEQRSLSFMVDEASGRSIIKVMDRSNDQLIRQIPSEELIKVAQDIKKLQEEMGQSLGVLVDKQV
ncbi:MAG: flagellar protein FlaG [Paraglaciecola sp.]|uniref:flagellar protein FlaG n=1 Tax=Alteromonadaceae TaxID=72275 RepID=UPI00273D6E99|nr:MULTISPECIES: flagellar protein FlaG [Alteromonadaceae]MDP4943900.1 flagellar protein FlaG [Alishewanella sp.]MDP5207444.1 flagellar protein FlaG [Alishewanella sp. SMS9]MDP5028847.1 flagellar protein FlaG [Paraglaciecola sp.]MDP5036743.1 flagellar protein FlaG [Alishewanella sp.]MDP5129718.1 flagellar protein FlaG [Paraglaciecola sp.]